MTTQLTGEFAEERTPTRRASRGWIGAFTLAYLGINIVWAGPAQVLMSPQVERLTAEGPGASSMAARKIISPSLAS